MIVESPKYKGLNRDSRYSVISRYVVYISVIRLIARNLKSWQIPRLKRGFWYHIFLTRGTENCSFVCGRTLLSSLKTVLNKTHECIQILNKVSFSTNLMAWEGNGVVWLPLLKINKVFNQYAIYLKLTWTNLVLLDMKIRLV